MTSSYKHVYPAPSFHHAELAVPDTSENIDGAALLVRVSRERNQAAFAAVFAHYAPRIKAYLVRIGCNTAEADELMQETLFSVWQKAERFDPQKSAASTWIFTIARNRRIDALRQKKVWVQAGAADEQLLAALPDPAYTTEEQSLLDIGTERVQRAMQTLPANQADVIRLAYLEEKTHQEISTELALPLGTVKSRIRAALIQLQACFSESQ